MLLFGQCSVFTQHYPWSLASISLSPPLSSCHQPPSEATQESQRLLFTIFTGANRERHSDIELAEDMHRGFKGSVSLTVYFRWWTSFFKYIFIFAFGRCFYTKCLTLNWENTFNQCMHLGNELMALVERAPWSTVWLQEWLLKQKSHLKHLRMQGCRMQTPQRIQINYP